MSYTKTIRLTVTILCVANFALCQHYDSDAYDYSSESDAKDDSVEDSGFVTPLDFSPIFGGPNFGLSSAASNSPTKKYQSIFDVGGAESRLVPGGQDFFQGKAAGDKQFSPENFGFRPTFSQGYVAETAVQPKRYQVKKVELDKTKAANKAPTPLQFNIQTKHEKNYKKQPDPYAGASLASYKDKSPELYTAPAVSDYQVLHPKESSAIKSEDHLAPYKKFSFQTQGAPVAIPTYQALSSAPYSGASPYTHLPILDPKLYRYKRYSGNKRKQKARKSSEEDEDEDSSIYSYYGDYKSRPKEFDESSSYESPDFGGYGDNAKQKQYDYGSDEEYGFDEYEKIKSLSEKQAQEAKQDPENCKKVEKDSMTCMVCQNPKTGGSYESCSYVSEPKNNKYAYVKEQKFDSNDKPEEQEETVKSEAKQKPEDNAEQKSQAIRVAPENIETKPQRGAAKYQTSPTVKSPQKYVQPKYQAYYTQPQKPEIDSSESTKFAAYKEKEESDDYDDEDKDYEYKSALPGFFTDNEPKKNVEHVLAEFAKKDRSECKKIFKNGMTCYQCTDKTGLKHEECMFVSESAPKSSHLAYKEIKEFNSKPEAKNPISSESDEAESKVVPTLNPAPTAESITVLSSTIFPTESLAKPQKKKQLFKKYVPEEKKIELSPLPTQLAEILTTAQYPNAPTIASLLQGPVKRNVKRSASNDQAPKASNAKTPLDESPSVDSLLDNIAHPSEFASDESKGAFWAETVPRYSKELGVSLPEYMLSKSEHEELFDEFLSTGK